LPNTRGHRHRVERFDSGNGVDAYLAETGAAGEVALEMLSSVGEPAITQEETPSALEFLNAIESHGNLPVPSAIFRKVERAIAEGDARVVARLLQSDPVIATALINYSNAARFSGDSKTSSLLKAVQRLGMNFVLRVVFVASMMMRYRKGRCAAFDYRGYWMNAIATGSAMRALMPQFGIPEEMADDAFAAGLVSNIGWLAVAETYPALMAKYLDRCGRSDPLTKIRAQREIFPCVIRLVSARYVELFSFPEIVLAVVAGKATDHPHWGECLAHAMRTAQRLAPFNCLAVLPLAEVPEPCLKEWENWQVFLAGR
jgi:HD-like signal output (HDOD) protein